MNLLLNRDFTLNPDGWIHVVPLGEYPHPSGVTQVIDADAVGAMVNRFKADARAANFPGLLVDLDHFSDSSDKPSEAAGWIEELENRNNGVWARVRWTDTGEAAVKGGRYRLTSPVFSEAVILNSAKKVRPLRLLKVALTNDPNLKGMVPLSNRQDASASAGQQQTQTTGPTMKRIAELLGLSAEAAEDAVFAEVAKLKNRADNSTLKVTELEKHNQELLTAQVETDLEKYSNRFKPETKEIWKKQLLANRASTIELLESMEEVKAPGTQTGGKILNRQGAGTPATRETQPKESDERALAAKANAEVETFKLANRCSYSQARDAVRAQKPELFGLAASN